MNSPPSSPDAQAIRSDIAQTRRRMDATINALGARFQPRHLLDEALGCLRQNHSSLSAPLNTMREKISHHSDAALQAVVDTVKKNPLPLALMGVGVAWMIYNHRRSERAGPGADEHGEYSRRGRFDSDTYGGRSLDYPTPAPQEFAQGDSDAQAPSPLAQAKATVQDAAHNVGDKIAHAGATAREKFDAVRERVGEMYSRAREGVSHTVESHPLETGLICLAAGVLAGLAIPTPGALNRRLGPAADRLRDRVRATGQEVIEKGRVVAQAAVKAVREEVRSSTFSDAEIKVPAQQAPEAAAGEADKSIAVKANPAS